MTVGKITSSQQDVVFISVRPEDGGFLETIEGGNPSSITTMKCGQVFEAEHWFGRIKIMFGEGSSTAMRLALYDGINKDTKYFGCQLDVVGVDKVLHISFDPLPPGPYYWEVHSMNDMTVAISDGSTFGGAYDNEVLLVGKSFKSKVMYCTDSEVLRPVAVVGDPIDGGVTTVSSGSSIAAVEVSGIVKDIVREGDPLSNGGKVFGGSFLGGL
jgi:hypothetical protein